MHRLPPMPSLPLLLRWFGLLSTWFCVIVGEKHYKNHTLTLLFTCGV